MGKRIGLGLNDTVRFHFRFRSEKKTFSMEDWDSLENVFDKHEMVTEIFRTALEM